MVVRAAVKRKRKPEYLDPLPNDRKRENGSTQVLAYYTVNPTLEGVWEASIYNLEQTINGTIDERRSRATTQSIASCLNTRKHLLSADENIRTKFLK